MSLLGLNTPVIDVSGGRATPLIDTGGGFVATNPTPGTGITTAVAVTLAAAATAPSMVVVNQNALNSGINVYPLYLKLTETVVSTTGTAPNMQFHLDTINRYTSGGTILTGQNTSSGSNIGSKALIAFGALVAPAGQADIFVSGNLRCRIGLIDVAGDIVQFTWGTPTLSMSIPFTTVATIGNFQFGLQSVGIQPGHSLVMTIWKAAITVGITYEVEFGYLEK